MTRRSVDNAWNEQRTPPPGVTPPLAPEPYRGGDKEPDLLPPLPDAPPAPALPEEPPPAPPQPEAPPAPVPAADVPVPAAAAPAAARGVTLTVEAWAAKKGMAARFIDRTGGPAIFTEANPLYQDFAQARAHAAWAEGATVTEEEFDEAIVASKGHVFR